MLNLAASLIAAGAAQREGFERDQLTVGPDHIVLGDFDCREVAGLRTRIDSECGKAVRMRRGRPCETPRIRFSPAWKGASTDRGAGHQHIEKHSRRWPEVTNGPF